MTPAEDKQKKTTKWYWPEIHDEQTAIAAINIATGGYYAIAAMGTLLSLFLNGASALVEAVLIFGIVTWLKKSRSIWLAILGAIWSIIVLLTTFQNKLDGKSSSGGSNIFLAIMLVGIAITGLRAAWFLRAKETAPKSGNQSSLQPDLSNSNVDMLSVTEVEPTRKSSISRKSYSIAGGICLFVVMAFVRGIGHQAAKGVLTPTSAEMTERVTEGFSEGAKQINDKAPTLVDKDTRLDRAIAGPGAQITYYYTMVNMTSKDVDNDGKINFFNITKKNVCGNEKMKPALKYGGKYSFVYIGSDGVEILRFSVAQADCDQR